MCEQGGADFSAYAACVLDCTCSLDLYTSNIIDHCDGLFPEDDDVVTRAACACYATKCSLDCIASVPCPLAPGYSADCANLQAMMPCEIGCPLESNASSCSSAPCLDISEVTCISGVGSSNTTHTIQAAGSESGIWVTVAIAGGVFIFLLCLCYCTVRGMKQRRQDLEAHYEA